jgi:hypothetical protein
MPRPDFKHREATYQTLCAQIVREATDLQSLAAAAGRVLGHPDACSDAALAAMLRGFIAQQEAALRQATLRAHPEQAQDKSQLKKPFEPFASTEFPTKAQLLKALVSLRQEFEVSLAEYNKDEAQQTLRQIEELARRFPIHVDAAAVQQCRNRFEGFVERCELYRRQAEEVGSRAIEAAKRGEPKVADWLLRRLRAIHALTPVLLSAEKYEEFREAIERVGQKHARREARAALIARERAVADRIKRAGAAIYRFHRATAELPCDSEEYQRAESAYRAAVKEVRGLDTDWLTGLLLDLETYLDDLHDPDGRTEMQLDRFVGTVRTALTQLRREIRAITAERDGGQQGGGPDGSGGFSEGQADRNS